jgi:hypothetical protein
MMDTQIKTSDTTQHLEIESYNSEEPIRDFSKEDYASHALGLWSPWQTPLGENIADTSGDSINLREEYEYLTCYIWLPEECNVADIDPCTILLNDSIRVAYFEVKDELQLLIAKFSWSQVKEMLKPGLFEFTVSGQLLNGTPFDSSDMVAVIGEEKDN